MLSNAEMCYPEKQLIIYRTQRRTTNLFEEALLITIRVNIVCALSHFSPFKSKPLERPT